MTHHQRHRTPQVRDVQQALGGRAELSRCRSFRASDRLRRSDAEKRRPEAAALLYREAIEINDSVVQGMAAAQWALETGRTETGLRTLEHTIAQAQELVSGLIRQAGTGAPGIEPVSPPLPGGGGSAGAG